MPVVAALITSNGEAALVAEFGRARLGENDVRVRVQAASISRPPERLPGAAFAVLGSDFVGEIIQQGRNVTAWSIGDRVWGNVRSGACAEELVVNSIGVLRLEQDVDPELATIAPVSGFAAMAAVDVAPIDAGRHYLVSAAGGATSCVLAGLIREGGGVPIATCHSAELSSGLTAAGFEAVLVGRSCPEPARLREATAAEPIAAVYDCATSQNSNFTALDLDAAAPVVRVRASELPGFLPASDRDIALRVTDWVASDVDRPVTAAAELLRRLGDGRVIVPVARFSLDEGPTAWELVRSHRHVGKVVLRMY
jgi:NADPH:quinone reductase-like Zn-dependent oxidoreductase